MKPWEKYGNKQSSSKPWEKYGGEQSPAPVMVADEAIIEPQIQEPLNEAPSWGAVAGETLTREVPSNILGAPMDILGLVRNAGHAGTHMIADAVGLEDNPYRPLPPIPGGSEWFKENVFREIADRDNYTKAQDRTATVVGMGTETAAGGLGLAKLAKNAGEEGMGILQDYITKPKSQIVKDGVSGAGAGAGLQVAEENEMGPIGTIMSMILGGAGAAKTADTVTNAATAIPKAGINQLPVELPDGGPKINRGLQKDAARVIQGVVDDPMKRAAGFDETPQSLSDVISRNMAQNEADGVRNQTTGPTSESFALSGLERDARLKNPIPFKQSDETFKNSVTEKVSSIAPENADIEAPQNLARQEGSRQIEKAQSNVAENRRTGYDLDRQLQSVEEEGLERVAPIQAQKGQKGDASSQLNEQIGKDGALGERTKIKNDAFDEAAEGSFVDARSLLTAVEKIKSSKSSLSLSDNSVFDKLSSNIKKYIADDGTLEGPNSTANMIPADEVIKLRRELNSEISAARKNGDYSKADTYTELKNQINKTFEFDPNFKEANTNYKENYAPFFAQGYGKKFRDTVQKGDGTGQADTNKIADIFLTKGRNAARDLSRIVEIAPDQKAANDAVERYMAADLASKMGDKLNPRLVKSWIDNNADKLDEFPEIKQKFESLQNDLGSNRAKSNDLQIKIKQAADSLKDAEKDLTQTQARLNKGVLGSLINDDPDKYVKNIMGGNNRIQRIQEVKKLIGDNQEAMDGFKKAVVDDLVDRSSDVDGNLTLAKMKKADVEALSEIYTPEEMNTVRRMSDVLQRQRKLDTKTTPGSDTEQNRRNQTMKTALEAYLKIKYGVLKGGGIMRSIMVTARLLPDRKDEIESVIQRAMLDPKVAKKLLDTDVSKVNSKYNKELNALMAVHATGREMNEPEEDELIE